MARAKAFIDEAKQRASILRLEAISAETRAMDTECDAQLVPLGITGFHEIVTEDGRRFRVPEYFDAGDGELKRALIAGELGCA
jgi:hypothetical protein